MRDVSYIVGVDEVGRGPLAGPVAVCACCCTASSYDLSHFKGIRDSKKLSPQKREEWFHKISELKSKGEVDFVYSFVSATEIDAIGIVNAINRAMRECLDALALDPMETRILLDGALRAPRRFMMQETIIKGDEKVPLISAASIIAKVMRDRYMIEQAVLYPAYGFQNHKGYGTDEHYLAIRKHGITPLHRKTFLSSVV